MDEVFEVELPASILLKATNIIQTVGDDIWMKATTEGVTIMKVDASHAALAQIYLGKRAFDVYRVDGEPEVAMNLETVREILKLAHAEEKVKLSLGKDSRSILEMGPIRRHIRLLGSEGWEWPKVPSNWPVSVTAQVETSEAKRAMKAIGERALNVDIKVTPSNVLTFEGLPYDSSEATVITLIKGAGLEDIKLTTEGQGCASKYAMNHLSAIISVMDGRLVELKLGQETPVRADWSLGPEEAHCTYLLAPVIESET